MGKKNFYFHIKLSTFSLWKYLGTVLNFVIEDWPTCPNTLQQEFNTTSIQTRTNILRKSVSTMV